MSKFFTSSIGQKFFVSITGLFLMMFLCVHLTVNATMLFGDGELYNRASHFMGTNPIMKIVEPILALGFLVHILYASYITLKNQKARPVKYKVSTKTGTPWASRNMYILGGLILVFLVLHLSQFFWKVKFGHVDTIMVDGVEMENLYALVAGLFINWWYYDVIYILGAVLLGLHLVHGFWSAFQSLGWDNDKWINRLKWIARIYAIIIAGGFIVIPLFFLFLS